MPSVLGIFIGSARNGLSALPVQEKAIPGALPEGPDILWWVCSQWPFLPACRGKGYFSVCSEVFESPWRECLRLPFHPACRGKGNSERQKQLSATAIYPCLSRKKPFRSVQTSQDPCRRMQTLLPVDEKAFPSPREASGKLRNIPRRD